MSEEENLEADIGEFLFTHLCFLNKDPLPLHLKEEYEFIKLVRADILENLTEVLRDVKRRLDVFRSEIPIGYFRII